MRRRFENRSFSWKSPTHTSSLRFWALDIAPALDVPVLLIVHQTCVFSDVGRRLDSDSPGACWQFQKQVCWGRRGWRRRKERRRRRSFELGRLLFGQSGRRRQSHCERELDSGRMSGSRQWKCDRDVENRTSSVAFASQLAKSRVIHAYNIGTNPMYSVSFCNLNSEFSTFRALTRNTQTSFLYGNRM